MPGVRRTSTKYPGVYYIKGKATGSNRAERIYYIRYRKDGREIEEKAGRQFQDDLTPARAAQIRARRIDGDQLSNKERREAEKASKKTKTDRWTIDRLWQEYKAHNPGLKGLYTDEKRYEKYLKPKFGNNEPKDLIQLETDRLRINLLKKKKPQTVKHVLALLRRIVNFGVAMNLCEGISFKIKMPAVHNERTEDLSPNQINKLLKAIDEEPNIQAGAMMKMALFTGMRRGEILRLKWEDIDFQRGFILIRSPKGGPDQKIPLNDTARKILLAMPKTGSPYVFPGRGGKQKPVLNKRFIKRIRRLAGLPKDFRPMHGLRHTYASMLASSGKVDMYTLQKLLTHKDPRMTQRYAHLRDKALKRAADLAGDIISKALEVKDETALPKSKDQ